MNSSKKNSNMNSEIINLNINQHKGKLFLNHNGWDYDLSAPPLIEINFSPTTQAVDKFIKYCASLKNIKNNDLIMEVQKDWFFLCDAALKFDSCYFNGWMYEIKAEKIKMNYNKIWICPLMKVFFENPPQELYVKVEESK